MADSTFFAVSTFFFVYLLTDTIYGIVAFLSAYVCGERQPRLTEISRLFHYLLTFSKNCDMMPSMEIYKNLNCKKIRGSHVLDVSCAHCKYFIASYQKVGESNFVKMYNDRIIDGSIDFSQYHGAIHCPDCGERIATRYMTKPDKKEAYRFVPSAFNKKKV